MDKHFNGMNDQNNYYLILQVFGVNSRKLEGISNTNAKEEKIEMCKNRDVVENMRKMVSEEVFGNID